MEACLDLIDHRLKTIERFLEAPRSERIRLHRYEALKQRRKGAGA
jgi:hypothetical protein